MPFDLRSRTENQRRLLTIAAGVCLLALIVWVAMQAIEDASPTQQRDLWLRFALAAVLIAVPWGIFVWRKLSNPRVADWKIDARRYFFLFVGLGILFRRRFVDSPESVALVAGAACGYVAATLLVYLYDLTTNRLSRGRSWHYPDEGRQRVDHSSNT